MKMTKFLYFKIFQQSLLTLDRYKYSTHGRKVNYPNLNLMSTIPKPVTDKPNLCLIYVLYTGGLGILNPPWTGQFPTQD